MGLKRLTIGLSSIIFLTSCNGTGTIRVTDIRVYNEQNEEIVGAYKDAFYNDAISYKSIRPHYNSPAPRLYYYNVNLHEEDIVSICFYIDISLYSFYSLTIDDTVYRESDFARTEKEGHNLVCYLDFVMPSETVKMNFTRLEMRNVLGVTVYRDFKGVRGGEEEIRGLTLNLI